LRIKVTSFEKASRYFHLRFSLSSISRTPDLSALEEELQRNFLIFALITYQNENI